MTTLTLTNNNSSLFLLSQRLRMHIDLALNVVRTTQFTNTLSEPIVFVSWEVSVSVIKSSLIILSVCALDILKILGGHVHRQAPRLLPENSSQQ